jgi:FtsH-binding integral membrane protein
MAMETMDSLNLVANASAVERQTFYRKTYAHVALGILGFIAAEWLLINNVSESFIFSMISSQWVWLLILGGFWMISMFTDRLALSPDRGTQYAGLMLFAAVEAIIFLPLIYIALVYVGGDIIKQAAVMSLSLFAGLSALVLLTKADFSFLKSALIIGGFIALGIIVGGALFGFQLGLWFSVGMVILAAGSILYETSRLKYQYHTEQYVGAGLRLFASLMLLFYYILTILLRFAGRD